MATVLISGATGLVGHALCKALRARGYAVRTLSRSRGDVRWDVAQGTLERGALDGVSCVVHLAGEPIAQRWSEKAKRRILQSRVDGTALLAREVLKSATPPAFICASGINFYGYQCAAVVDEDTPSGDGFLAQVCREWEAAVTPLTEAGVRTVCVRTGIVLSREGGALAKLLIPFSLGAGGRIGSGQQQMSWIGISDLVDIYLRAIEDPNVRGAVNAVAPQPVTNNVFTKTLGKVIRRPTLFPLPAAVVKLLFGEMGRETILADLAVLPKRLKQIGFEWKTPEMEAALAACLRV